MFIPAWFFIAFANEFLHFFIHKIGVNYRLYTTYINIINSIEKADIFPKQ
jgi:hypothetical protein